MRPLGLIFGLFSGRLGPQGSQLAARGVPKVDFANSRRAEGSQKWSFEAPCWPLCGKSRLSCRRGASLSKKRCNGVQKSTLTPRVTPLILMTVCHLALKKLKKSDFGVHRLCESPNGFPKITSGSQSAPQKDPLASTMPPKMA